MRYHIVNQFNDPAPPGVAPVPLPDRNNFYEYACGHWLQSTPILADQSRWTRSFTVIGEHNEEILRDILTRTASGTPPAGTPYASKLGDFYGACMDEAQLERSLPVLKAQLARATAVTGAKTLAQALGRLHARGVFPLFHISSNTDLKDATQVIGELNQGGLGLPDRDYYLSDTPRSQALRMAYGEHIKNVFGLLGETPEVAARDAAAVLELETALARVSQTNVEQRESPRASITGWSARG